MKYETLNQVIDKIPHGTVINIGASISFFYCYYKDNFTKQRINKESDKYLNELNKRLLRYAVEYDTLDERKATAIEKVRKMKKVSHQEKELKISEISDKFERSRQLLPKAIDSLKTRIANFVPLLDRIVLSIKEIDMPTYTPKGTKNITVVGKEKGAYWDIQEYARKKHLKIKDKDNKWDKILEHRKHVKPISKKKPKGKGKKYKLVRDENGKAIGLVEIKEKK